MVEASESEEESEEDGKEESEEGRSEVEEEEDTVMVEFALPQPRPAFTSDRRVDASLNRSNQPLAAAALPPPPCFSGAR